MKHRSILSPSRLGWLSATGLTTTLYNVAAQTPPPPPPPPPVSAEEDTSAAETDPSPPADAPPATEEEAPTAEPQPVEDPAVAAEPWDQPVGEPANGGANATDETEDLAQWFRKSSLRRSSSLNGSTGLQRVREAGSGAPGTFRFGVIGGFYSGKGFLCHEGAQCRDPITGDVLPDDSARRTDAYISLSATPFAFMEAFAGLRNSAVSNSDGTPAILAVVGDTNLGVKFFSPAVPDQIFSFGGEADLYLMTGSGGVGLAGSATSFDMRALGSMDLNNRTAEEDRIPLRAHVNLGYFIDNSGKIVKPIETTPPPDGRGSPIERTERYGLGISRVDSFEIALGTEYIHPYVRPFMEWSLDIPVNRQGYVCNVQSAASRGDLCLGGPDGDKKAARLGTAPSRLSFGARVFPWQPTGLALTAAVDIGTGATSTFLEEVTPETPYTLWLGVAYAVDVVPPPVKQVQVDMAPAMTPETRRYVLGRIIESSKGAPVPDAVIRYDGVPMTGLVADSTGQFISQDLPPGEYSFKIFAQQFKEGLCTVTIPQSAPPEGVPPAITSDAPPEQQGEEAPADATAATDAAPAPTAPYADADGNILVPLDCQLEELPRVANIVGLLVDSVSGGPVADASVTIMDNLNRSLKLSVDKTGSFQFRNVPFGAAFLTASAPGYLSTVTPLNVDKREGLSPHLLMNARPTTLALKIGPQRITLDRPIEFVGDQADVTINSMSMIEELAEALKDNEKLDSIEIQVHTDDSGAASYSRQISQERAEVIKDILVRLGVAKERLTAKGYGPDQPLAPNVSEANRAANNRVQIMIQKSVAEF